MRSYFVWRTIPNVLGVALFGIFPLFAQTSPCSSFSPPFNGQPAISITLPLIYGGVLVTQQDAAFDCMMWQTFIYLNWPAKPGQRGVANTQATFGSSGQTVWESFKSIADTFPANGQNPGPWNSSVLTPSALNSSLSSALRQRIASGRLRMLSQTSKISSILLDNVPTSLSDIMQVGGGVLVDQAGANVYYEIALNETEYEYIVVNTLYEAATQYAFAKNQGISLPIGTTAPQSAGSIEIKAAWKVLTSAELNARPVRFHTAQALLPGSSSPVTVGLVGLHIAQRAANMFQLVWATFSQIDNAPPVNISPTTGSFSFYKVGCAVTDCPVNQKTTPPEPTQVMEATQVPSEAEQINGFVQNLIKAGNPSSPWQFYRLVNVQWPTAAIPLPSQPLPSSASNPPNGSPNTTNLLNPVLETFFQSRTLSCLACHQQANSANPANAPANFPASYSFAFLHATSAPVGTHLRRASRPIPGKAN